MECQYKTISSNGDTEREWLRGWVVYRKEPQGNEINQHMNKTGQCWSWLPQVTLCPIPLHVPPIVPPPSFCSLFLLPVLECSSSQSPCQTQSSVKDWSRSHFSSWPLLPLLIPKTLSLPRHRAFSHFLSCMIPCYLKDLTSLLKM